MTLTDEELRDLLIRQRTQTQAEVDALGRAHDRDDPPAGDLLDAHAHPYEYGEAAH